MGRPEDHKYDLDGQEAVAKLRQLLPRFKSTMMITQTPQGLHMRPLALEGDLSTFGGVLWFFTDVRSQKVQESANKAVVSLSFQNDEQASYLHLTGSVTVMRDLPKMRELFTPRQRAWFPDGLDDPNLTLIKFEATDGSYWDSPGGVVRAISSLVKSVATGTPGASGVTGALQL